MRMHAERGGDLTERVQFGVGPSVLDFADKALMLVCIRRKDLRPQASIGYSPCEVVAVSREVVSGLPMQISTSHIERQNLSLGMASRRFTRLTNEFSKKLDNHVAAVSLYVAHYNFCRVHETLRSTPAATIGVADHVWSIGELLDAALARQPIDPVVTAPDRRRRFQVIEGGKK
jgi:hypothetical protein